MWRRSSPPIVRQGRDVVLVVDGETVSPGSEQPLREALTATTSMLSPHDRVGVLSTRQGGANVALTSRHASKPAGRVTRTLRKIPS